MGITRDKITGDWRRLHSEELQDLYSSPNTIWMLKSRRMRWEWHKAYRAERSGGYRVLVRKPERKRPLGRIRHRWEENIKRDDKRSGM